VIVLRERSFKDTTRSINRRRQKKTLIGKNNFQVSFDALRWASKPEPGSEGKLTTCSKATWSARRWLEPTSGGLPRKQYQRSSGYRSEHPPAQRIRNVDCTRIVAVFIKAKWATRRDKHQQRSGSQRISDQPQVLENKAAQR